MLRALRARDEELPELQNLARGVLLKQLVEVVKSDDSCTNLAIQLILISALIRRHQLTQNTTAKKHVMLLEARAQKLHSVVYVILALTLKIVLNCLSRLARNHSIEPLRLGVCILRRDDLHLIATIEQRGDGHYPMVYLCTYGMVANLRMYLVCKVEHRRSIGQRLRLSLGREHDDVALIKRELEVIEELECILRGAVKRIAHLLQPAVETILLLRYRGVLILPVRREATLCNVIHALRAHLHLHPRALRTHHRGVQRLVAIGLGYAYPVAQTVGLRGVYIRDAGIDLPALRLLRGEGQRLKDNAYGKEVVDLLEGYLLAAHLIPDGVDALHARRNLILKLITVEHLTYGSYEAFYILLALALRCVYLTTYLIILLGEATLHAEILQLTLYGVESEAVCQRHEEVYRLARNLYLLVVGHGTQRAHVMQAVCNLYDDDAHIVREREQHLTEVLRLLGGVILIYPRHLRETVDHRCNLGREDARYILHGVLRILYHVVEQCRHHRLLAQTYLPYADYRHLNRVDDVWLTRTATHTLMRLLSQQKGALDKLPVVLPTAHLRLAALILQLLPLLLYEYFILGCVHHISLFYIYAKARLPHWQPCLGCVSNH